MLDRYEGREEPWTKEANIVSWNGGEPKIDIRDWSESHERMSRGITLSEEQAERLAMALGQRIMLRQKEHREKDAIER